MLSPSLELEGEQRSLYQRLSARPGPRGQWRALEDAAAVKGQSLSARAREEAGVDAETLSLWFDGITLDFTETPPAVVLPDYPSVSEDRHRAAAELGRLAGLGKISWREEGSRPPDLRVCPPHLIAKGEKSRVAHDWSCVGYPLNSVLANPPVQYSAMGDFLQTLSPGAYMGGVDFQDCFLHWLVAPARRRFLGVRHPLSGILGVYLFLPFGLGPVKKSSGGPKLPFLEIAILQRGPKTPLQNQNYFLRNQNYFSSPLAKKSRKTNK